MYLKVAELSMIQEDGDAVEAIKVYKKINWFLRRYNRFMRG